MNHTSITIKLSRIKNAVLNDALKTDKVIIEEAITIQVVDAAKYTVLCTPSDVKALVVGFLFAEGFIESFADIGKMSAYKSGLKIISVQVKSRAKINAQKNLLVTSSCGLCGVRNIKNMLKTMPVCGNTLTFAAADLCAMINKLQAKQEIFQRTGGAHAAGIFDASDEIISFAEDLGRHNALDKAIGNCLLKNHGMQGCGVVLSSRVSFEMVAKAAHAGIEMIIAVSAPSSLAIEAAKKWNITLCGFVRGENANVYTGVQRIN